MINIFFTIMIIASLFMYKFMDWDGLLNSALIAAILRGILFVTVVLFPQESLFNKYEMIINEHILTYYYTSAIISLIILICYHCLEEVNFMGKIITIISISALILLTAACFIKLCLNNIIDKSIYYILIIISIFFISYLVFVIGVQWLYKIFKYKDSWYFSLTLFPHIYFIGMNSCLKGLKFDTTGLKPNQICNKKYELSKTQIENFINGLKPGFYVCDTNIFIINKLKKCNHIYDIKTYDIYYKKTRRRKVKKIFYKIYGNNCENCDLNSLKCNFSQDFLNNYNSYNLYCMITFKVYV